MNKILLFSNTLIITLLLFSCNKSLDKSAAKTDAMEVVKALNEAPQSETTTTLTTNEEISNLEEETEKKATQKKGEVIEAKEAPVSNDHLTKIEVAPKPDISPKEADNQKNTVVATSKESPPSPASPTVSTSDNAPSIEKPEKQETSKSLLSGLIETTNSFLSSHVSRGLVAYSQINKSKLKQIVDQTAATDLSKASSLEKQAFYINAYNILVIHSILKNDTPSSPLDVLGFFDAQKYTVAGESLTLNQLEKGKLFGLKKDARFHFAVVCGAIGCPQIESFAYTPSMLNAQLDRQTKKALNDPNFTKVNDAAKKVELSEIFKWYESDFTQGGKSLIEYINQYRNEPIPSDYTVDYYPYNWKINQQ